MIQQITVFLENEEGRLSAMTRVLAEAGINMKALTIAETTEYGLVRIVADKPEAAVEALRAADYRAITTEVLAVSLGDEPGTLAALLEKLDELGTNIEYAYCFSLGAAAMDVLKVKDPQGTAVKLANAGFTIVKQADLA